MKISLFLFFNIFITAVSFAQQDSVPDLSKYAQTDTLFLNAKKKVCSKDTATYYRLTEVQSDWTYRITDMYIKTNTPQAVFYSATIYPVFMIGKCTFYYPDGKKQEEGYFKENKRIGYWYTWTKRGWESTTLDYNPRPQKSNVIKSEPFLHDTLRPFSIAARAKAASFFIIEDTFFATFSLGSEMSLGKHSIGVDYTWFRWRDEYDNSGDTAMYSQYQLRTYYHIDYKYTFLSFEWSEIDFYINLYDKIGKYRSWYDKYDYDFGNKDMTFLESKTYGTFNEVGAGLGMRKYAEKTGFGLDVSMNVGKRFCDNNEQNYISATEKDFRDHVKSEMYLPYMRINCFYIFGKRRVTR